MIIRSSCSFAGGQALD